MPTNLTKEIASKAAMLPPDLQLKALEFVESLIERKKAGGRKDPPFESVEGILTGNYDNIDRDIAVMRKEVWKNFPREFE